MGNGGSRRQDLAKLEAAQEQERLRREAIIAEARQTIDRVSRLERAWLGKSSYTADNIKQSILRLLEGSTKGHVWTRESMMRALGCDDAEFMNKCLEELVKSGRLRKVQA
jgi:hypothetical protein